MAGRGGEARRGYPLESCPACQGSKTQNGSICPSCYGTGKLTPEHAQRVRRSA